MYIVNKNIYSIIQNNNVYKVPTLIDDYNANQELSP